MNHYSSTYETAAQVQVIYDAMINSPNVLQIVTELEPDATQTNKQMAAFRTLCAQGHLATAQEMWSVWTLEDPLKKRQAVFQAVTYASLFGHTEVAHWLQSLYPEHVHLNTHVHPETGETTMVASVTV